MELGLLLLRLTVGSTLAAHGAQKLFGWFGGPGFDIISQHFGALGFHPGRRHALTASVVEIAGGLLLALGLFTPLAAALALSVMIVAAVSVHVKNGFFITAGGFEYNLVFGVAALTIAFTGPGTLSLDALLGLPAIEGGARSGLAALVIAVLGATASLAQRRTAPSMATAPAKS